MFCNRIPNNPDADYTTCKRPSDGVLGTTNRSVGTVIINNRMSQLCRSMKAQGIIILSNTTTQNLFRTCATSPAHYFNSPTNEELEETFVEIGNELTNLRLAE